MPVARREVPGAGPMVAVGGLGAVITPVERCGGYWLKRDDLWGAPGLPARGGKARTADAICRRARGLGVAELCSAHDRNSGVPAVLARVCRHHGVSLRVWLPASKDALPGPFLEAIKYGAVLEEVRPGYMSVRQKRMRDYAEGTAGRAVVLGVGLQWDGCGMVETAAQTCNVVDLVRRGEVRRVVVPVGSGGMLRAVAFGLMPCGVPILGVCCGSPPEGNLPSAVTLVQSSVGFAATVEGRVGEVELDPVYEAKCLEFMEPGDLLWIVAHRDTECGGGGG